MVASILTSLIILLGVMTVIECCIIPCMRGLIQGLIETALTKQTPVAYQQNNLLLLDTAEHESQKLLAKFEEKSEIKKRGGE